MRRLLVPILLCVACKPGADSAPAPVRDTPPPRVTAAATAATPPEQAPSSDASSTESGQTFLEGMEALCRSIEAVPINTDPAAHQQQVARWIDANVSNAEVRELFTIIGDMPPSQRPGMLRAASAKAGVQNCALAER